MAEFREGQTAINPKDGRRIVYKSGKWHDAGQASAPAAATEQERNAGAFLIRGLGAENAYRQQNVGPRSMIGQLLSEVTPDFLNILPHAIGNSPRRQVADSAQDEFIAASLRQDSGAAIPDTEMNRQRRIYFPMPGDGPDAIAAKKQARLRAIKGLEQSSGRLRDSSVKSWLDMYPRRGKQGGNANAGGWGEVRVK